MKNIETSVGVIPTQEKKQEEVVEEGKKYIRKENEVIFCLEEAPEFQISAVARWGENARGEILEQPDIYFRHVSTGRLCQSVWACLGDEVYDQYAEEKWETLAYRLRVMLRRDLRRIVCGEKKYEIHPSETIQKIIYTKMEKEYNARGEKTYKNAINRENAREKKQIKK